MSSAIVRSAFKTFIATNAPTEKLIDLSSVYQELKELLEDNGITSNAPWLGIEFVGSDEIPITIGSDNDTGKYRESGAVYFHLVDVAKLGVGDTLLTRGENLRNLMRGRRIGTIIIDSVTPLNFSSGATLNFEGGYMSASFIVGYENDLDL